MDNKTVEQKNGQISLSKEEIKNVNMVAIQEQVSLENKLLQLDDTMVHIGFVLQAGHKLARQLFCLGEDKKAIGLLQRILKHDHSKSQEDEFYGLAAFACDVSSLKNPNVNRVGEDKFKTIRLHWERNDHHPEKWADKMPNSLVDESPLVISDEMPELAIVEMCCDWYARSMQYNTNVMEFYQIRTKNRWKFSDNQLELIERYLKLLMKNE